MATHTGKCWAIVPAAGIGSRMNAELPKQYLQLAGTTVLEHSVAALLRCDFIEKIVIALHPQDLWAATIPALAGPKIILVEGGDQRSDSVLAGLAALEQLAHPEDWILVHDAARPCVLPQQIKNLQQKVRSSGVGGILAQPILDTVKRVGEAALVEQTLPREQLWAAQTPQMFAYGVLCNALESARQQGLAITDEASAMERAGECVQLVAAAANNLKITLPEDLALAEFYLAQENDNSNP